MSEPLLRNVQMSKLRSRLWVSNRIDDDAADRKRIILLYLRNLELHNLRETVRGLVDATADIDRWLLRNGMEGEVIDRFRAAIAKARECTE